MCICVFQEEGGIKLRPVRVGFQVTNTTQTSSCSSSMAENECDSPDLFSPTPTGSQEIQDKKKKEDILRQFLDLSGQNHA